MKGIIKAERAVAATILMLLLLAPFSIFAQDASRKNFASQQTTPAIVEVPDSEEQRRFVEEHSFDNPSFRQKQRALRNIDATPQAQVSKQVRMIYLVPADKAPRADYQNAIANAISDLQRFYRNQLGSGYAFALHSPSVEVYQTPHTAAFYSTGINSRAGGYYENVLSDSFALTGGGFNDPNYRWVFYMDADQICGQYVGGTSGIALLPANDLRGLTNQPTIPVCSGEQSQLLSVNRWIGGLGHELGHAFNLPHPPGCDDGHCTGGQTAYYSLMYVGYYYYPNTYFLDEDKTKLSASGFFNVTYDISGRVASADNAAISGASVTINETQSTVVSDASGLFSFTCLPANGSYTLSVAKTGYRFTPSSALISNLNQNQSVNFNASPNPAPVLISEENSTRALALDAIVHTREPFQNASQYSWGDAVDRHTRIMVFATNLELASDENASAVTAQAEDSAHRLYTIEVERISKAPGLDWLSCIVLKLNDDLGDTGDVLLRITYHNASSNRVRVGIGHVGGGLPDDAGATPTPTRGSASVAVELK